LSLPLLVGSGLLVRTLVNLQRVDLGYPKDDLLTLRVDAQAAQYEPVRQALAFESLLERIRAIPGVRSATFSNNGLFQGSDNGDEIEVEGYTRNGDGRRKDDIWATQDQGSSYDQVGPGYFSTLGVPILLGREITAEDRPGGRTVCVINETFAKKFFAGRHPIGLHVTQKYAEDRHTYEIVGVVRDSRQNRLRREIEHRIYMPATQPSASINAVTFIIRPHGDGSAVLAAARRVVQQAEPKMTMSRVGTVTEAIDSRIVQERLLARLSIGFGIVAILLAAMGLYGVLSYGVARRTSEIGIRKALGAQPAALIGMILRETGWLLAIGLIAGGALAAGAMQLITSQLYGLSASDPLTFAIAIAGLTSVALVATWLPAYRASRVDPLVALRYE
jgi:predicted permease